MIIGEIDKDDLESEFFTEDVKKALRYLKDADFSALENKEHLLDGRKMFVNVFEYETRPKSERKAEEHNKYIDIHFIISGKEKIGSGQKGEENSVYENYSEETDAALYNTVKGERFITLHSRMYAVFLPGEIHRPGCNVLSKCRVRKAVVKIASEKNVFSEGKMDN